MSEPVAEILGLDPGIAPYVVGLRSQGVATIESCEGGPGHGYPEPTVAFDGSAYAGFQALGIALQMGFPVRDLRRVWKVIQGEPSGPTWEMTFHAVKEKVGE